MISATDTPSRYGWISMTLHWAVAALVVASYAYGMYRGFVPREARGPIMDWHSTLSILAVGFIAVRIAWRLSHAQPAELNDDKRLVLAHKLVVGALNWLPVIATVTGILTVMSVTRATTFFGIEIIPGLAERNRDLHDIGEITHVFFSHAIAALFVLHAGAAIWHHRIKKDATLARMLPWGKVD